MTELSFSIEFPRFSSPPNRIIFHSGINLIYGESGIGKTSFCQKLAGLELSLEKTNFEITDLSNDYDSVLVMQNPDDQIVAPTLYKELAFNFENLGMQTEDIQKGIIDCIRKYEFYAELDRHPSTLSGGEKEILNLVTSLSLNPKVVIIDDGLAFLSVKNKHRMISMLKSYVRETDAVIIWTSTSISDYQYSDYAWELRLDRLINTKFSDNVKPLEWNIAPGTATLQLDNLSFSYDSNHPIFTQIDLTIGPFRGLGLLGDNGVGKSTLGFLIVGILKEKSGKISITLSDNKSVNFGLLPQFPERTLGGRTFFEVIDELTAHQLMNQSSIRKLVKSLKTFQIIWDVVKNKPIHTLKLSIVRIVMIHILCFANYEIIILDEPLFSLGFQQKNRIITFLRRIMDKKHLIIATHDKLICNELCDCILQIEKGSITPLQQTMNTYVKST